IDVVENALKNVFRETNINVIFLVDRLDEGYTPDTLGVAIVDGCVQAVIDLNAKFNGKARGVAFLRDNMYRSIAINDPDFTRNIEEQVFRLHWDEYALFNMLCKRLSVAINPEKKNSTKISHSYYARELSGRDGF